MPGNATWNFPSRTPSVAPPPPSPQQTVISFSAAAAKARFNAVTVILAHCCSASPQLTQSTDGLWVLSATAVAIASIKPLSVLGAKGNDIGTRSSSRSHFDIEGHLSVTGHDLARRVACPVHWHRHDIGDFQAEFLHVGSDIGHSVPARQLDDSNALSSAVEFCGEVIQLDFGASNCRKPWLRGGPARCARAPQAPGAGPHSWNRRPGGLVGMIDPRSVAKSGSAKAFGIDRGGGR